MKITCRLAVPDEVLTEYAGTHLGTYFTDARCMYETQIKGAEQLNATFGAQLVSTIPRVSTPSYVQAAALGSTLVFPEDHVPMMIENGAPATADIAKLKVPNDYLSTPVMARYVEMREEMSQLYGAPLSIGAGLEGPVTTAKLVRGQDFFVDIYTDPAAAHALLEIATESYIQFCKQVMDHQGRSYGESAGICDDFSGLLSPAMYAEFAQPYHQRIYEELGKKHRSLHSELLRRDHLSFLPELGIESFDPGQDQYLDLPALREELEPRGIAFWWNIKTTAVREGTPESIQAAVDRAVAGGATRLMTELTPMTPPENVHALLAAFRKYE